MKPQSIYREKEEQCLLRAEAMTDPEAKRAMTDAAQQWHYLADLVESLAVPKFDPDDKSSR